MAADPPVLYAGAVARILGIHHRSLYNREQSGMFPPPRRNASGWRVYSIDEVVDLQLRSSGQIQPLRIAAVLYDEGHTDAAAVKRWIRTAMERTMGRT